MNTHVMETPVIKLPVNMLEDKNEESVKQFVKNELRKIEEAQKYARTNIKSLEKTSIKPAPNKKPIEIPGDDWTTNTKGISGAQLKKILANRKITKRLTRTKFETKPLDTNNVLSEVKRRKQLQKPVKKPAEKNIPNTTNTAKPKNSPTIAQELDTLILKGGTFVDICAQINAVAEERGLRIRYQKGGLNSHIKYRLSKNSEYLGKLQVTETGIF